MAGFAGVPIGKRAEPDTVQLAYVLAWAVFWPGLCSGLGCVLAWAVFWPGLCSGLGCWLGELVRRSANATISRTRGCASTFLLHLWSGNRRRRLLAERLAGWRQREAQRALLHEHPKRRPGRLHHGQRLL